MAIALSDGRDSAVLLHVCAAWRDADARVRLVTLHTHHDLHADAGVWECACRRVAQAVGVMLYARCVNVAINAERGVEGAAREAQYAMLEAFCMEMGASILLTAHHQDDRARMVLLQLMYGTGLDGLAAMPIARTDAIALLRPQVDAPRSKIELYAHVHALYWVKDPSNIDARYTRNALCPLLADITDHFPAYREAPPYGATHLADTVALIDETVQADLSQAASADELSVATLSALSAPRQRMILHVWLAKAGMHAPSSHRLEDLHTQLIDARDDGALRIELPAGRIRRYRDIARIDIGINDRPGQATVAIGTQLLESAHSAEQRVVVDAWGGVLLFASATSGGITTQALQTPLILSPRRGDERIVLRPGGSLRALKQAYQEAGIPTWEHQRLSSLYAGEMLVFATGLGMSQAATHSGTGWRIAWRPGLQDTS